MAIYDIKESEKRAIADACLHDLNGTIEVIMESRTAAEILESIACAVESDGGNTAAFAIRRFVALHEDLLAT